MHIHPIFASDIDTLREMWRDSYGVLLDPRGDGAIAASLDADAVRSMFAEAGGCLVALNAEALVGSVCFAKSRGIAYIWGMYVQPDRQRRGIGTANPAGCTRSRCRQLGSS